MIVKRKHSRKENLFYSLLTFGGITLVMMALERNYGYRYITFWLFFSFILFILIEFKEGFNKKLKLSRVR